MGKWVRGRVSGGPSDFVSGSQGRTEVGLIGVNAPGQKIPLFARLAAAEGPSPIFWRVPRIVQKECTALFPSSGIPEVKLGAEELCVLLVFVFIFYFIFSGCVSSRFGSAWIFILCQL